jgi:thioredoxin reductase
MTLSEAGAKVTVAMRREPVDFQSHLRPFIVRDLKIMAGEQRLTLLTNVRVASIALRSVELVQAPYTVPDAMARTQAEERWTLPNDFVFTLIGQTADPTLFSHLGIPLGDDGLPLYDEVTAETNIPRLYIAGSLSRANIILESRRRAVEIVAQIVSRLGRDSR